MYAAIYDFYFTVDLAPLTTVTLFWQKVTNSANVPNQMKGFLCLYGKEYCHSYWMGYVIIPTKLVQYASVSATNLYVWGFVLTIYTATDCVACMLHALLLVQVGKK